VVTVEEHQVAGGLGGVVAELLAERLPRRLLRIGLPEALAPVCGSHEYILKLHGLDAGQIPARVRAALDADRPTGSTS
jgi:transketolase